MKKVDLIRGQMIRDHVEFHIGDRWIDWRLELGNYPKDNREEWVKSYREVIDTLPDHFEWSIDFKEEQMVIMWEDNREAIPLEFFYDDKEEQPDLTLLWHENYWDGPLSGVALYNGEHVWFDIEDEDDIGDRVFALYKMSKDICNKIFQRHKEFQEAVGFHCDHDPSVYKPFFKKDDKKFREFYDKEYKKFDIENGEVLGHFHWFQFKNWVRPA